MSFARPWFEDWFNSPYYYQLYRRRDREEAILFIDKLLDRLQPAAGAAMLDIACGKGRYSIQLASKGYDVTGIDLSPDSIAEAKQNETGSLHFFVHDMRLPFWINYFEYAFNFFTSFGYFDTRREHNNAIRTISQSLKPNGVFVIDYLNVHYAESELIPTSNKKIGNVDFHITRWSDENWFYKKILIQDHQLNEPLTYHEKVAKFKLGDFTEMLAYHEMQVQEVFGDYDFGDYDIKKSPRLIIVAKKMVRPRL